MDIKVLKNRSLPQQNDVDTDTIILCFYVNQQIMVNSHGDDRN